MNPQRLCLSILGAAAVAAAIAACTISATSRDGDAHNGRYLVEQVGMCIDCHSPRDEHGQFVRERWLQGAALPFSPVVPMPWAPVSKPIAGLPTLTDDQALTFLTTGQLPDGRVPLPPMPEYRFSVDDARDIIAYLRHPVPPAAPAAAVAAGDQAAR